MVHGGGGQGTDWMGTPDGRPGWATYFLQEGYPRLRRRSPGPRALALSTPISTARFPRGAQTYEQVERQFTAPEKAAKPYGSLR